MVNECVHLRLKGEESLVNCIDHNQKDLLSNISHLALSTTIKKL